MNGHPGTDSADIAGLERIVPLLEISHRIVGTDSGEADQSQHKEQEQAEQAQLDTFTRCKQLQVTLILALAEGSEKIYRIAAGYVQSYHGRASCAQTNQADRSLK